VAYTEPIGESSQLRIEYETRYNQNSSDKQTFNYFEPDAGYTQFDSLYSNTFESAYLSHAAGLSYRIRKEKWFLTAGASYKVATLTNDQVFPTEYDLSKDFSSILPSFSFSYEFSKTKRLRMRFRSSNSVPSVSQLQDVVDNSNPLQLSSGNPALEQDWSNSLFAHYSSVNPEKSTHFFIMAGISLKENYIGNSTLIASTDTIINGFELARGSQFSKPVNLDGYINLRSFMNYSLPLDKIKCKLNFNLHTMFSRTPGLINDELSETDRLTGSFGVVLSSNISERFDFTLSSNTSFNDVNNSQLATANGQYVNQRSALKLNVLPWAGINFETELTHEYNSGLSEGYDANYLLWNAGLGYKFLKNRQAELRLTVFDMLGENISLYPRCDQHLLRRHPEQHIGALLS
jgi:hypothetical protein